MKKGKSVLTRRVLASLLAGVLLGSVGYVQSAAAAGVDIAIDTQEKYENADSSIKDGDGNIKPGASTVGNKVNIGIVGGVDKLLIGSTGDLKNVYGGYSEGSVDAVNNQVYINSGQMNFVDGGISVNGDAIGNSVVVSGGTIGGILTGGSSATGKSAGNSVIISGGTVGLNVYGGISMEGTVTGNSVIISGGTIGKDQDTGKVYGGFSNSGAVTGNVVTVSGGIIQGNVSGGWSNEDGAVTGNSVTVSGGKIGKDVYGGYSKDGTVTGNNVTISNGKVNQTVSGGKSDSGEVTGNSVIISGGEVGVSAYGGYSNSGGYNGTGGGSAIGNSVKISGGVVQGEVSGGFSEIGAATGNSVVISGGEIHSGVYGGYSGSNGTVTGNSVYISGGYIGYEVYGGYSGSNGAVTGNSVTISGDPTFETSTILYGGVSSGEVSGNRLNIHTKGLEAGNVKNFAEYNFYLADEVQKDALLTLTGGIDKDKTTNISGSTVNVGMAGALNALKTGDTITLMANSNGITATTGMTYGQQMLQGVSIVYDITTGLDQEGKNLVTTIKGGKATAQSKLPVEPRLASVAFINSGADLLAGSGVSNAVTAAGGGKAEMFGAMSGGSMRYETGSHADVHGYNLALGVGKAVANKAGQLTFGPFVEYGHGNYTSYLDSGVRGDGNTKYYGIGLLARQDNASGVYYEGSLRCGRMDADYASGDMVSALGKVRTEYDSSSAYYGAHFGVGKMTKLNENTKADVYAKLLYTHQRGDSIVLQGAGAGEEYDFDAVDSTRARIGARLSKDYGQRGSGYVGVAYEYEFEGEVRATVKGFSTPSPSIKGSSGLLELGYILQPKAANDPVINIGLQGWGGKKQGFTGNVNFVWTF